MVDWTPGLTMTKALMEGLAAKFLESYKASAKDATWQQHSATFRRFWSDQVLPKGTGTISDDVCDVVIRILDYHGKGKTKESEAVAGGMMMRQDAWRKLFRSQGNRHHFGRRVRRGYSDPRLSWQRKNQGERSRCRRDDDATRCVA